MQSATEPRIPYESRTCKPTMSAMPGHYDIFSVRTTTLHQSIPLNKPRFFSVDSPCTVSGSLKLVDRGNKSCWKSKPEIENDRPRRNEPAKIGPSVSSKARKESSESLVWRNGGEFDGDLSESDDDCEDGIE